MERDQMRFMLSWGDEIETLLHNRQLWPFHLDLAQLFNEPMLVGCSLEVTKKDYHQFMVERIKERQSQ